MANQSRLVNGITNPAPSILSFLDSINRQLNLQFSDATNGGSNSFGTLTASKRPVKPFIIGFIPPDNPVNFVPVQSGQIKIGDVTSISGSAAAANPGELGPNFWTNFVHMCMRLKIDPKEYAKVLNSESGFNPTAKNPPTGRPTAQGIPQFVRSTALMSGVSPEQWDNFANLSGEEQLPFLESYAKKTGQTNGKKAGAIYARHFGGFPLPAVGGYAGGRGYMGPSLYYALSDNDKVAVLKACNDRLDFMFDAYKQNPVDTDGDGVASAADLARKMDSSTLPGNIALAIEKAQADIAAGAPDVPPSTAESQAESNAIDASSDQSSAGSVMKFGVNSDDPLSSALGRPLQLASVRRREIVAKQTEALRAQIDILKSTPPLVLLVNPKTFNRSYENSSDTGVKGRYGQIVHTWLERPSTIDVSGVTAGQYVVDVEGSGGLTNVNRIHSLSYMNLMSLIGIYKNNGRIFAGTESDPGIPILAFTIFIYYDEHIYLGSFDNFSVEDGAEKPYNMAYSFKFSVRYDRSLSLPISDYLTSARLSF